MQTIWAKCALTEQNWQFNVLVNINEHGRIDTVHPGAEAQGNCVDLLLPAPVNAHSHAFQRAMAGLTEMRGQDPADSFWSWRRLMFYFLESITPDQVEAIATYVQMEMLEAGFATNVEFHYLHHAQGGKPYSTLAEMALRIIEAARHSGIGLTLLPVFYEHGGLDARALVQGQNRFGNSLERFIRLEEQCRQAISHGHRDWTSGIAPHSMRAVSPTDLKQLTQLFPEGPIHMHLAEQIAEVDEVQATLGKRPVEWVLDELSPDARWHFVHLTQMLPHETGALAGSGASAVLCPITECNLGDGIFDGSRWLQAGGSISIGSDSNIRISLTEEIRTLEYSQRLKDHSRAALATRGKSTARRIFDAIVQGGAASAARDTGAIRRGAWADLMALNTDHVDIACLDGDTVLDSFAFARDDRLITDVWSAGRHMVRNGQHIHREAIEKAYLSAVKDLRAGL